MPYTHCSACGAKALVGATRCPRCQAPFVSYDPKADRVETVNCPKCGVQRPVAIGVCPNCLTSTTPSGWRLTRGLILTALAILAIVAVGYAISRRTEHANATVKAVAARDSIAAADSVAIGDSTRAAAADTTAAPSGDALAVPRAQPPAPATQPSTRAVISPGPQADATPRITAPASAAVSAISTAPKPAPPPSVAVPDTGVWESAVANTWVRVRSAPSITSEVLRMVDSAQRVRLGPPVSGWRPIRVGSDRGWVDRRLFTVVPALKP